MESKFNFPVLLFDGVCNLCSASVQWMLKHDKAARFRFAALQSDTGRALLLHHGLDTAAFNSVVLICKDCVYIRSDAALQVARLLGSPWSWLYVFRAIPRPVRNLLYDWIARNRYRWFGQRPACWLPRPEWRERFI